MDFDFTFFEVSVLVRRTAAPLSAGRTLYFNIAFDFARMNVSPSQSLHFGYLPGAVRICIQCQCQRGNSRHLFAPSSVLLFAMVRHFIGTQKNHRRFSVSKLGKCQDFIQSAWRLGRESSVANFYTGNLTQ